MPNYVGNHVIVTGPEHEISRLFSHCFQPPEPDGCCPGDAEAGLEFAFETVIPLGSAELGSAASAGNQDVLYRRRWGTKREAHDTAVVHRRPGYLEFEFITASDFPEPVYRELGRMFPALQFDVAAVDPGASWAVTGQVTGVRACFADVADVEDVYMRVYRDPPPSRTQSERGTPDRRTPEVDD